MYRRSSGMTPADNSDLPDSSPIALAHPTLEFGSAAVNSPAGELARQAGFAPIAPRRPQRGRKRIDLVPIVLVDQSALFRAGLRHILSGSGFRVTADCSSIHDVAPDAFGGVSTVAVIGLDRDVVAVLHRVRELKAQHPELRVIMLGIDAEQLVAAIDSGADGYLLRDAVEPKTLLKSLEMVLADGVVVPKGFAKLMSMVTRQEDASPVNVPASVLVCAETPLEAVRPSTGPIIPDAATPPANSDLARLSQRERLILTHLTVGASNKQIARDLYVAEATVKAHVKNLLRKLRVNNRTQAAMWTISHATSSEQVHMPD
jgi:two-component system, NarL family, nitrate/nitrite response regulator NarL